MFLGDYSIVSLIVNDIAPTVVDVKLEADSSAREPSLLRARHLGDDVGDSRRHVLLVDVGSKVEHLCNDWLAFWIVGLEQVRLG